MLEPSQIKHSSSKEEKDYTFDYLEVDLSKLTEVDLLGVRIHNISRAMAVSQIMDFVQKKDRFRHVLLIDPLKYITFMKGSKLHRIVKKASLVLIEGGGLQWAANRCGIEIPERVSSISLMMDLMRYCEKKGLTIFLLGASEKVIESLYFNLLKHFPRIRIVGRQEGYLNKKRQLMVKEALRKTEPDIVFLGFSFPEQEIWIENNMGYFGKAVVIGTSNSFDVLSGIKKAPDYFQAHGLDWLWKIFVHPWRLDKWYKMFKFYFMFYFKGVRKE